MRMKFRGIVVLKILDKTANKWLLENKSCVKVKKYQINTLDAYLREERET